MNQITLRTEFANLPIDAGRPGPADADLRLLQDLELMMVGGGEQTPLWGTPPTP